MSGHPQLMLDISRLLILRMGTAKVPTDLYAAWTPSVRTSCKLGEPNFPYFSVCGYPQLIDAETVSRCYNINSEGANASRHIYVTSH